MPVQDWTKVEVETFHAFHGAWITHLMGRLNGGLLPSGYYALGEQHADASAAYHARQRTLTIRRTSGHHVVALLEIVSPGNRDRAANVEELVTKVDSALMRGIHVLVVELFSPGKHDPQGIHGAIWERYGSATYDVPSDRYLTVASYVAAPGVEAYVEHFAVGESLPEMPLFLNSETYIQTPLEQTYCSAYQAMPMFWREVLEGSRQAK
jgi:hypothetical protein